ncbi:hypothetical protein KFE25_001297 [Diacronema lutheri]|uniref:NADH dehydrogenase [ubiquinone] 1 beta subcomplex subunit 7 n=2 Tax=Diacronema lutheri TaxID=2081491 RepID=A0A8J6C661_DIALT|nr:hypothetical protein KFE25_001297 [Diacronema lutheri]
MVFEPREGPTAELQAIRAEMGAPMAEPVSYVSRQEMHDAKVPLDYRDYCAHLLIPLNRCRQQELYLPWKCETLRNAYEKCQHNDYVRRRALKKAEEGA